MATITKQQILDAIAASPQLQQYRDEGNVDAIAKAISVGRKKSISTMTSERGILEKYPGGPVEADALLTKLENYSTQGQPLSSLVKRALKFLAQPEGIDIGSPTTKALVSALVSQGVLTTQEANHLDNMTKVDDPVARESVTEAIYG